MKRFVLIICLALLSIPNGHCLLPVPNFPNEGMVDPPNNGYIDPDVDYERFMGRVTDKNNNARILKIRVENNNTKFLSAGDKLEFKVARQDSIGYCKASVRSAEDNFFVVYVEDIELCWGRERYFPRGLQLNFRSRTMAKRVFEASKFREILVLRKEGYLKQLNDINHFLWTYSQQKIKLAAEYDEQINEIQRKKQLALDNILQQKQESILLQVELTRKLDELDTSLDHYTIERKAHMLDRWNLDHDQGLPLGQRPQKMKTK